MDGKLDLAEHLVHSAVLRLSGLSVGLDCEYNFLCVRMVVRFTRFDHFDDFLPRWSPVRLATNFTRYP